MACKAGLCQSRAWLLTLAVLPNPKVSQSRAWLQKLAVLLRLLKFASFFGLLQAPPREEFIIEGSL